MCLLVRLLVLQFSKILQPAYQLVKAMQHLLLRNPYFYTGKRNALKARAYMLALDALAIQSESGIRLITYM